MRAGDMQWMNREEEMRKGRVDDMIMLRLKWEQ